MIVKIVIVFVNFYVKRFPFKIAAVSGCDCGKSFENCIRFNLAMPKPLLKECMREMIELVTSSRK